MAQVQEAKSRFVAYVCPDCGYGSLAPPEGRPCIVCLAGRPEAVPLVMRVEADALAEALEGLQDYARAVGSRIPVPRSRTRPLWERGVAALAEYRSRHPKETP